MDDLQKPTTEREEVRHRLRLTLPLPPRPIISVDTLGHQPWPWIRGVMEELCREEARHQGNRGDGHLLAFCIRFLVLFISFCYSVVLLRVSPYDGDSWRFISVHGRLRSVMEVHPWFIAPPTVPRESRPHSHKPPSVTYAVRAAFFYVRTPSPMRMSVTYAGRAS